MNTENSKLASPYVGPRTFQEDERNLFFGREREARDLFARVLSERLVLFYAQSGAGKSSLVNTCLIPDLREEGFVVFPIGRVVGDASPEIEGGNVFIYNLIHSLTSSEPKRDRLAKLSITEIVTGLRKNFSSTAQTGNGLDVTPHVLIIDQFEELFSTHAEAWSKREDFFQQLADAMEADPYLWVVLVMREDFIASLDPYAHLLPGRLGRRYYMQRLEREAAIEAVRGPAEKAHRPFVEGVAEKLVDDLSSIKVKRPDQSLGIEPGQFVEAVQLQVVCISLWEKLGKGDSITEDDLRKVGDVDDALGRYYAGRVAEVARQKQVKEHVLREWIERKLIAPGGIRNVVLQDTSDDNDEISDDIIQALQSDIIRAEKRGGSTWYELTHDRLVGPILDDNRKWFDENLSPLQRQATLWDDQERNENWLLRDQGLADVEKWASENQDELTDLENEFLAACRKQQEQIKLNEQARSARSLRRFLAIVGVLALVAIIAAVFAFVNAAKASVAKDEAQHAEGTAEAASTLAVIGRNDAQYAQATAVMSQQEAVKQKNIAEKSAAEALSGNLAAQADSLKNVDYRLALLLGLEAYQQNDSLLTRTTLFQLLQFTPYTRQFGFIGNIGSVAVSPDGGLIATASCSAYVSINKQPICASGGIQLFRPGNVARHVELPESGINLGLVYSLAFHQYGQRLFLAAGGCAPTELGCADKRGQITIWDVTAYKSWDVTDKKSLNPNFTLLSDTYVGETNSDLRHTKLVKAIAFSPDGKMLASGSYDQTIILWDISENGQLQPRHRLQGHSSFVNSVAFSPDGKALVSAGDDKKILVWDLSQLDKSPRIYTDHNGPVTSIAFYPASVSEANNIVRFASASNDNTILLWDWASGSLKNPVKLQGHTGYVTSVAFNADGTLLASAGFDDAIILWDTNTGAQIGPKLLIHSGIVNSIAFGEDGKGPYLISGSDDRTVIKWDLSARKPANTSFEFKGKVLDGQLEVQDSLYDAKASGQQVEVNKLSGDPFLVISGFNTQISEVGFDQNNPNTLLTVDQNQATDGWATQWGLNPDFWVTRACNAVGNVLTNAQWDSFIAYLKESSPKETCVKQP